jgi:hypothetical protein
MMSRSLFRLAAVAAMALALSGCERSESYRYKLTVAVNTPDGVKRASSVAEVRFFDVSIPAKGTMHKLRGEALYLDLGAGARPLITLLTNGRHPKYDNGIHWSPEAGPGTRLILRAYGEAPSQDFMDDVPRVARMRGSHTIASDDLPGLVTFADVNDPSTVIEVDPNDLEATLGPNISWNEITLESTNEPITEGIERKLPWIPLYFEQNLRLDGSNLRDAPTLANRLSWWDFDQSSKLTRKGQTTWADVLPGILRTILHLL